MSEANFGVLMGLFLSVTSMIGASVLYVDNKILLNENIRVFNQLFYTGVIILY